MSVRILQGDCIAVMQTLPAESVDCVVTSPPYWGLRDYGVDGQMGLENSLAEHIETMVRVFREVRRILKPSGTLWLNYGDCYATSPNGRSAADTKAAGGDDRTFRDKPFSTIGPIDDREQVAGAQARWKIGANAPSGAVGGRRNTAGTVRTDTEVGGWGKDDHALRWRGGGILKPKDLCMIPNRMAIALQEDGWWVRSEIIWAKPNPMPESITDRPATSHEKIFLLSKSQRYFFDKESVAQAASPNTNPRLSQDLMNQIGSARANGGTKKNGNMKAVSANRKIGQRADGVKNNESFSESVCMPTETRNLRNYEPASVGVWRIGTQPFSGAHFATFPPELVERCVLAGCPKDGVVFDPFGGAGTTGLVAAALGRSALLVELNPEYIQIARDRIRAGLHRVECAVPEKNSAGPLFEQEKI